MTASIRLVRNVVLVGEAGSGKSSIINMIAGDIVAPVSEVTGTRTCAAYSLQIRELKYNVHDTPGIQARKLGTVTKYISSLPDGVGLLVFCMRGRITEDAVAIYQHFSRILHGVPVVVVITGLEHEDPMQSWWTKNQADFAGYGMSFKDSACVTTQRGKRSMFATQYEDSKKSVEALIATYFNQEVASHTQQEPSPITRQQRRRRLIIILATVVCIVVVIIIIVVVVKVSR